MEAPPMKVIGIVSTTALFLLLGATLPAFAQEEHHEEAAKPAKQEEAKPAKQEAAKPAKQQEQAKPAKQQEQAKTEKQQGHTNNGVQQHAQRSAAEERKQRSAPALRLSVRGSGRVPEDRFRASFGHEHVFVINEPVIVGGYSRFQYSGFWFGFVEPWPEGWYYTDGVYVDYIDGGYYLYNPYYPDARVSISVVI